MELYELKRRLAAEAKAAGICPEWYDFILKATSKERLITLFVKGQDFCSENNYPSPELRAEFADIRARFGVFCADDRVTAKSPRSVIAFDQAAGSVEYGNFDAGQVWARDNSEITITARNNAFVVVSVDGAAKVKVIASDNARVSVILHGGECQTQATEQARIKTTDKRK